MPTKDIRALPEDQQLACALARLDPNRGYSMSELHAEIEKLKKDTPEFFERFPLASDAVVRAFRLGWIVREGIRRYQMRVPAAPR